MDFTIYTDDDLDALRIAVLTEQERRVTIASTPAQSAALADAYAAAIADQPADDWDTITASTDRVGPGQRVILDGIEYRNRSGAWLPITAGPAQDPSGIWWERVTKPTPGPTAEPWSATATYVVGARCTKDGRVWECLVAHGPERQGTWAPGPATPTVWRDIGPA